MGLIHDGGTFHGTHEAPTAQAPELQTVRTKFAGVIGESEIRLGTGGRNITVPIVLHDGYTSSWQLQERIREYEGWVGDHGTLEVFSDEVSGVDAEYPNCTFEGFFKDPSPDAGPLPDYVGLLDGYTPSWWVRGVLVFRQLSIEEEA